MAVVNLLGDSIIDNKIYVGPHELSVSEHLYNLTDDIINSLAVDGHTTQDVLNVQLNNLPRYSTHQVLSIGGNDLLQKIFCLLLLHKKDHHLYQQKHQGKFLRKGHHLCINLDLSRLSYI